MLTKCMEIRKDLFRTLHREATGGKEGGESGYLDDSGFTHASDAVRKLYRSINYSWESVLVCLQTACIARLEAASRFLRFVNAKHIVTVTEWI